MKFQYDNFHLSDCVSIITMKLLTRSDFREQCLERDGYKCVICGSPSDLSVHHIIERRLWVDGGYYVLNGASLCEQHHIEAEQTTLSCEEIRNKAGITKIALPEHLYSDAEFTKWGDIILPNGRRIKGELFFDESVQKILKKGDVLHLYDDYVKYPRTMHFSWSNPSKDDKIIQNLDSFVDKEVIVTVKQDGENTNLYRGYCHARSLEPLVGEDRGFAKSIWASISQDIPEGWRICAENLYAKHSIHYSNLESYLQVFSIWNELNECLSWDDTIEWCNLLGLTTVPVLYRGIWDEKLIRGLYTETFNGDECEGYVVRTTKAFSYGQFRLCVSKFVRKNHVNKSVHHWRSSAIIPNQIKKSF